MKIKTNKINQSEKVSQIRETKVKSYRYERELEKKQLKKETKQRDLIRKNKMGWVF